MSRIPTFSFFIASFLLSCSSNVGDNSSTEFISINGEAQGTTYQISFRQLSEAEISKKEIDSVFAAIDMSLSIWQPNSVISHFNNNDTIEISDSHFITVYYRSLELSNLTDGAFQPMILPLVQAWGFGKDRVARVDEIHIDSLLTLVHTPVVVIPDTNRNMNDSSKAHFVFKKHHGQQLDVNGIAQGYTVDVLAGLFELRGIDDYMIEVGGEVRARGKNTKGTVWRIGIDKPQNLEEDRTLEAIVNVGDRSIATSGSYRKFYEKDGRKYSHTIDPVTGYPVDHQLLSVTVMASNCTLADGFATAFMVFGVEKTKTFLSSHRELGLDVFLIFNDKQGNIQTYISSGMQSELESI